MIRTKPNVEQLVLDGTGLGQGHERDGGRRIARVEAVSDAAGVAVKVFHQRLAHTGQCEAPCGMSEDVERARELLEASHLRNTSELNLAAAQVHATLAVEAAVRELLAELRERAETDP